MAVIMLMETGGWFLPPTLPLGEHGVIRPAGAISQPKRFSLRPLRDSAGAMTDAWTTPVGFLASSRQARAWSCKSRLPYPKEQ